MQATERTGELLIPRWVLSYGGNDLLRKIEGSELSVVGYFEVGRFSKIKLSPSESTKRPQPPSRLFQEHLIALRVQVDRLVAEEHGHYSIFPLHLRRPFCLPLVGLPQGYEV